VRLSLQWSAWTVKLQSLFLNSVCRKFSLHNFKTRGDTPASASGCSQAPGPCRNAVVRLRPFWCVGKRTQSFLEIGCKPKLSPTTWLCGLRFTTFPTRVGRRLSNSLPLRVWGCGTGPGGLTHRPRNPPIKIKENLLPIFQTPRRVENPPKENHPKGTSKRWTCEHTFCSNFSSTEPDL